MIDGLSSPSSPLHRDLCCRRAAGTTKPVGLLLDKGRHQSRRQERVKRRPRWEEEEEEAL